MNFTKYNFSYNNIRIHNLFPYNLEYGQIHNTFNFCATIFFTNNSSKLLKKSSHTQVLWICPYMDTYLNHHCAPLEPKVSWICPYMDTYLNHHCVPLEPKVLWICPYMDTYLNHHCAPLEPKRLKNILKTVSTTIKKVVHIKL